MKFEQTARLRSDRAVLDHEHFAHLRRAVIGQLVHAAVRPTARAGLRRPEGSSRQARAGRFGVWEMTWRFAGPDGRATFERVEVDGEPAIRRRRVGGHASFSDP